MKWLKYLVVMIISCQGSSKINSYDESNMIAGTLTTTDLFNIYSTWDSCIVIKNKFNNKTLNKIKCINNCYAKPILIDNKLYFPISDYQFSCYDIVNQTLIWNSKIGGICRSFKLCKNILIVNEKHYGISGLDINSGEKKFELKYIYDKKCSIPDLSPYYILCDDNNFYVCDWQCQTITAFNGLNGTEIWGKSFDDLSTSNGISLNNNYIFLGIDKMYQSGKIYLLDAKTGEILFEENNKFEIRFNPIRYNDKIYFYSYDNQLNEFDIENRTNKVVFNFDATNSPGADQMFLLDNYLYYSAGNPMFIYRFNLTNNKLQKLQKAKKSLYGVYKSYNNKIEFIY